MWRTKKVAKKEIAEKNDLKYWLISTSKLILGNNIYESEKEYIISQNIAELVKTTRFYKKWDIKVYEK
jgi:hypothetical protein